LNTRRHSYQGSSIADRLLDGCSYGTHRDGGKRFKLRIMDLRRAQESQDAFLKEILVRDIVVKCFPI
jgi:hypothetical protein